MSSSSSSAPVVAAASPKNIEEGTISDGSDEVMLLQEASFGVGAHRRRLPRAIVATVLGVAGCAALVVAARPSVSRSDAVRADTDSKVSLFGPVAAAAMFAEGAEVVKYLPALKKGAEKLEKPLEKVQQEVQDSKPLAHLERYENLTAKQEIPKESLHDGNLCADDEEENLGLCYEKCSTLTKGEYPIRTTAWSCCKEQPCTFFNSKFTNPLSICEGFDVSGDKEGKACPHRPGTCLVNEEFNLGMCFKKCAILTNNKYPYRSAASTCCRYNSHWACLDPLNTFTSPEFNVGGGEGDGSAATPGTMHAPMPELTEG